MTAASHSEQWRIRDAADSQEKKFLEQSASVMQKGGMPPERSIADIQLETISCTFEQIGCRAAKPIDMSKSFDFPI